MRRLIFVLLCVLMGKNVISQQVHPQRLKVFIDCSRTRCDRAFIISEIRVVDFLLDRIASDVHVLITSQGAGGGGRQYQLIFYGQHSFKHLLDTLRFTTDPNATDSELRDQLVHNIKLGLIPFVSKTAYAGSVKLEMKEAGELPMNTGGADKWNYWVFRVGVNGEFSGERVYKSNRGSAEFSAQRTTEKLKVEFYVFGSQRKSKFEYESSSGNTEFQVKNSEYGLFHNIVRSFDAHWSYGYQASYSNNTFSNYKSRIYVNPAIEYNIFPYQQANNRFFVLRYGIDLTQYNYYDSTIYNKIDERLFGHKFSAALTLNQKWGTFNSGVFYRNYLHNWELNSMGINVNVNVRITGGLSFNVNSSGRIVHDQVYLVKGAASEQEVLTRRRQLASSFNYNTSFGVNYRFGSKLNNFINPRFEGYGGF